MKTEKMNCKTVHIQQKSPYRLFATRNTISKGEQTKVEKQRRRKDEKKNRKKKQSKQFVCVVLTCFVRLSALRIHTGKQRIKKEQQQFTNILCESLTDTERILTIFFVFFSLPPFVFLSRLFSCYSAFSYMLIPYFGFLHPAAM